MEWNLISFSEKWNEIFVFLMIWIGNDEKILRMFDNQFELNCIEDMWKWKVKRFMIEMN